VVEEKSSVENTQLRVEAALEDQYFRLVKESEEASERHTQLMAVRYPGPSSELVFAPTCTRCFTGCGPGVVGDESSPLMMCPSVALTTQ
jgi:hypothetical protein